MTDKSNMDSIDRFLQDLADSKSSIALEIKLSREEGVTITERVLPPKKPIVHAANRPSIPEGRVAIGLNGLENHRDLGRLIESFLQEMMRQLLSRNVSRSTIEYPLNVCNTFFGALKQSNYIRDFQCQFNPSASAFVGVGLSYDILITLGDTEHLAKFGETLWSIFEFALARIEYVEAGTTLVKLTVDWAQITAELTEIAQSLSRLLA